jgi:O-antigen/teichoic acid export membrane protein
MIALSQILDHALRGRRQVRAGITARVASSATLAVLCLALVPRFGVQGLAASVLAAAAVELGLILLAAPHGLGMPVGTLLRVSFADCRSLAGKLRPRASAS